MNTDTRSWRRLTAEAIAGLPQAGGVFEVANMVRTVQFIGAASGNLRTGLAAYVQESLKLLPITGGYYFRYESAAHEDEALDARLSAYRSGHGGLLPGGNAAVRKTLTSVRPADRVA